MITVLTSVTRERAVAQNGSGLFGKSHRQGLVSPPGRGNAMGRRPQSRSSATSASSFRRRLHADDRRRPRTSYGCEEMERRVLLSGSWTTLTNLPATGVGLMLQLPDGSIMMHGGSGGTSAAWYKL